MAETVTDLKNPFVDVFNALDLKAQRKAIRGAMRKEGNRVRTEAVNNLASAGIGQGTNTQLSKGIYVRVYPAKYGCGFMVTVKPHGEKGIHTNRFGKKKPVLMWAEDGTDLRHVGKITKTYKVTSRYSGRKIRHHNRGGGSRGKMQRYGFLAKTEAEVTSKVETNLFSDFQKNIEKAAKKQNLL